jgi:hypothetical protein
MLGVVLELALGVAHAPALGQDGETGVGPEDHPVSSLVEEQ